MIKIYLYLCCTDSSALHTVSHKRAQADRGLPVLLTPFASSEQKEILYRKQIR